MNRYGVSDLLDDTRSRACEAVVIGKALKACHLPESEVPVATVVQEEDVLATRDPMHTGFDRLRGPVGLASRVPKVQARSRDQPMIIVSVLFPRRRWEPSQSITNGVPRLIVDAET
jgi:hypothetical protein